MAYRRRAREPRRAIAGFVWNSRPCGRRQRLDGAESRGDPGEDPRAERGRRARRSRGSAALQLHPASLACPAGPTVQLPTPPQVAAVRDPRAAKTRPPRRHHATSPTRRRERELAGLDHRAERARRLDPGFLRNTRFPQRPRSPAPGVWNFSTFNFDSDMAFADSEDRAHHERDRNRSQRIPAHQPGRQDHHVARLGGSGDLRASTRSTTTRKSCGANDDAERLLPPVYGARHASCGWSRAERLGQNLRTAQALAPCPSTTC